MLVGVCGRRLGLVWEIYPVRTSRILWRSQIHKTILNHSRHQTNGRNGPATLVVDKDVYHIDSWTNVPTSILSAVHRRLHVQPCHPLCLTRQILESRFKRDKSFQPSAVFTSYNSLPPVVTVAQNFDSLGFPPDHPGRSRTDTYYINGDHVLRTHTSAHQADVFRENKTEGYLISADVYRRDAIDRSHNPIFHQMEGARMWDRRKVPGRDIARAVRAEVEQMPIDDLEVDDPNPTVHAERNPLQEAHHTIDEVEAIAAHLKRSLEGVVFEVFQHARRAAAASASASASADMDMDAEKPVQVRWVEAYFPFTSPSWELEVYWEGDWLEVLGCGIVKQELLINAGVPDQVGWAFGVGLDRIAMLLFGIPDIRLLWSHDSRFLSQFTSVQDMKRFVPFSKYPACYKDVSFWLRSTSSAAGGGGGGRQGFHENDVMEIVREVGGSLVEDVRLVDEFSHPSSGRKSLCYRINYRSLERTLRNTEANELHEEVRRLLVEKLGVELR